jgi:transcription termination/antitermination protein NusG
MFRSQALFSMSKEWFVFYTRSRQEKKVNDLLTKKGFKPYLPLQTVMRQWSDRRKKVVVPLFNAYIFVFVEESVIPDVLQVPGIAWNIKWNGKPAILRDKEMETIRRFIETGLLVETQAVDTNFSLRERVEIVGGPLRGTQGIITDFYNRHLFTVLLESIGQSISVQIDRKMVKALGKPGDS